MQSPANIPNESSVKPANQSRFTSWLKRIGLAGVWFFLIKGLLWIIIPVLMAKGCL
jgi:hypothetical protein